MLETICIKLYKLTLFFKLLKKILNENLNVKIK